MSFGGSPVCGAGELPESGKAALWMSNASLALFTISLPGPAVARERDTFPGSIPRAPNVPQFADDEVESRVRHKAEVRLRR